MRYSITFFSALTAVFFSFLSQQTIAQCVPGEGELSLTIYTDAWGYETYWEIYAEGDDCGENPILFGGNDEQVGCDGGGEQDANGDFGYENNTSYDHGPECIVLDQTYVLNYVDDYGDGGFTAEVFIDGQLIGIYTGGGNGDIWTFNPSTFEEVAHDQPCQALALTVGGGSEEMNNEGALASVGEVSPGGGNCGLQGVWCEGAVTNSVWASFIAPEDGGVFITTCLPGTEIDTQIALYEGECDEMSGFELISANDDIVGGCGGANVFASGMYASCLAPGEEYLIQIDGWNAAAGTFFIEVTGYDIGPVLTGFVNDNPCPIDKGEDGAGSIAPYFVGYGSNFEASWVGPNDFTSNDATIGGLLPGAYTLTATTDCGEYTETFVIENPEPISGVFQVIQPECPLSGDGAINVTITGGTQPYTYSWEGDDEFTSDFQDLEGLNAGEYVLQIEDENGCPYESPVVEVDAINEIPLDLGADQTLCLDEDLLIFAPPGYDYQWQDNSINQFYQIDAEALGEGTYSFICTVTNEEGCEAIDAIAITVENCLAVEERLEVAPNVYPNPSEGQIRIGNLHEPAQVILTDASGRQVLQSTVQPSRSLDISQLSQGVYNVLVVLENQTHVQKLILK